MASAQGVGIRPITERDVEGFRQAVGGVARERHYLRLTNTPAFEGALAFVRTNIASGNPQFVAEHDGIIVGWCDILRETFEAERHSGVLGIGLLPAWRGVGIGTRLMATTLAAADAAGFLRVELTVNAENERAIRLYQHHGFAEEGRKRGARLIGGRLSDVLVMGRIHHNSDGLSGR